MNREGWILIGFALLFVTAITVSVCGWILLWRSRGQPKATSAEERVPLLPPANPLR